MFDRGKKERGALSPFKKKGGRGPRKKPGVGVSDRSLMGGGTCFSSGTEEKQEGYLKVQGGKKGKKKKRPVLSGGASSERKKKKENQVRE